MVNCLQPTSVVIFPLIRLERLANLEAKSHQEAKSLIQQRYFGFEQGDLGIPVFAFVGRITVQKGVHLILDVAEQERRDWVA